MQRHENILAFIGVGIVIAILTWFFLSLADGMKKGAALREQRFQECLKHEPEYQCYWKVKM